MASATSGVDQLHRQVTYFALIVLWCVQEGVVDGSWGDHVLLGATPGTTRKIEPGYNTWHEDQPLFFDMPAIKRLHPLHYQLNQTL